MSIPFRKYHGLGNDFIVLDGVSRDLPLDLLAAPDTAKRLCRRHRGIGADGLLLISAPVTSGAAARMRVINADGSEPEMCGNGIRCVVKALHDHATERVEVGASVIIDTGAGPLRCDVTRGGDGAMAAVRVSMGRPVLHRGDEFIDRPLTIAGHTMRWTAVSVGNPHLVTFVDTAGSDALVDLARDLGSAVEHHELFPDRTNVEFARLRPEGIDLVVWERGCGITQACGTGACATVAAAVFSGRCAASSPVEVRLPGGPLTIEVARDRSMVWMEGPAEEVYQGTIEAEIPGT